MGVNTFPYYYDTASACLLYTCAWTYCVLVIRNKVGDIAGLLYMWISELCMCSCRVSAVCRGDYNSISCVLFDVVIWVFLVFIVVVLSWGFLFISSIAEWLAEDPDKETSGLLLMTKLSPETLVERGDSLIYMLTLLHSRLQVAGVLCVSLRPCVVLVAVEGVVKHHLTFFWMSVGTMIWRVYYAKWMITVVVIFVILRLFRSYSYSPTAILYCQVVAAHCMLGINRFLNRSQLNWYAFMWCSVLLIVTDAVFSAVALLTEYMFNLAVCVYFICSYS